MADNTYIFGADTEKILKEVTGVICDRAIVNNAVIRIWRDDKSFNLINSCMKGCS